MFQKTQIISFFSLYCIKSLKRTELYRNNAHLGFLSLSICGNYVESRTRKNEIFWKDFLIEIFYLRPVILWTRLTTVQPKQ